MINTRSIFNFDLQADEGKDGKNEGCEKDHVSQVLHAVDDGVDNSLEAGDDRDRLERPEHAEGSQCGETAEVDSDGDVRHCW